MVEFFKQMIEFFKLNTRKIIFWSLMMFPMMAAVLGIPAFFGYRSGQFSMNIALLCVLATPLFFSLLSAVSTLSKGAVKLNKRNKVLQKTPFSQLGNIGFRPCYINYGSGKFEACTEKSIAAVIDGFTLTFDIPEESGKVQRVIITPMVKKMKILRKELKNIKQRLQPREAFHFLEYSHGRLNKLYPVDVDTVTIGLIKNEVEDFVLFLKSEGFEPSPDPQVKWILA